MLTVTRDTVVAESHWRELAENHRRRVAPFVQAHLARRSRAEKHPVFDFLFEYYSFRPAYLLRWSPGHGVELEGGHEFAVWPEFRETENGAVLDIDRFPEHRIESLAQIHKVLAATLDRPAFHGCLGLHEWAMVYDTDAIRHGQIDLRLSPEQIKAVVDSQPVCCSHYDAYRFFTPAAVPLNVLRPTAEDRAVMEQPGCIHANMDLYKWAYKFYPWISSDIIGQAFELAIFAREIDMRASPYDLSDYGYQPVLLETEWGKREYQQLQREVARRARPIRVKLVEAYEGLLGAVT